MVGHGGDYRLEAVIAHHQNDVIGYRRDPQEIRGKIRKNLVANEACRLMGVDITLYEGSQVLFGPKRIEAFSAYDYVDGDCIQDLASDDTTVLAFSLGQLEPQETAFDAAQRPLYRKLSQKIVDAVIAQLNN